jgi:hypothetical protein
VPSHQTQRATVVRSNPAAELKISFQDIPFFIACEIESVGKLEIENE